VDRAVQCVATDPLRRQFLACGTFGSGLWLCDTSGRHWQRAGDELPEHAQVTSVAISAAERAGASGVIYAGTEPSKVYRSDDSGRGWKECPGLLELPSSSQWSFPPRPQTHHVRWIHQPSQQAGRLYVAIEAGALVRSYDSGQSWHDRVP